ncbi:BON domain-containing protein, partial [Klebsiella pneumoniae]|uniref:BON domain-containing protein n=1 Tax=Klebsiella pneumoniae TaxID=573 RepID=UPI0038530ACD
IERDLANRAHSALQAGGLAWAASAFQGRDGVLSGKAADVSDPDKALELVGNVWGVRIVDNRTDLIKQVENYNWAASRKANRVRLSGYVPNQA